LGPKLEKLAHDIYNGRGFCLVRGLDINKYSVEDLTMIWLGIQSYIAEQQGRQDKNGNMLGMFANPSLLSMDCRVWRCRLCRSDMGPANSMHPYSPHPCRQVVRHLG
jgi:hypothetical protein